MWHHESPLFESTTNQLLLDWHRESYEQCGFIDSQQELWYVPNVHDYPSENFLMEEKECERIFEHIYEKNNDTIIGIFHTHPNNVTWPSPRDIVGWPNPKLNWRYFIVTGAEVLEWELFDD